MQRLFRRISFEGLWFAVLLWRTGAATEPAGTHHDPASPPVATYSIVALDPATGDLGVAVQSKFFGVGSVVPWAKARVGAIATQSFANTTYGPRGLALLESGRTPAEALALLTESDPDKESRQVGIVDGHGRSAAFTGSECNTWAGHRVGTNYCVQGNILAGEAVVAGMAAAFEQARSTHQGELADWLLAALKAAEAAGGDRRGRQSAALLVVRERGGYAGFNDRYADLRVDDHPDPVTELGRLWTLHQAFYARKRRLPPQPEIPATNKPTVRPQPR